MAKLRFRLEGPPDEEGTVAAGDFSDFLSSLLDCLKQIEKETSAQAPVEYRIVGLEVGSAVLELEPRSEGDVGRSAARVAEQFEAGFSALQAGEIRRAPFSRRTKSSFLSLMKPLRRDTRSIEFTGHTEHRLSRRATLQELPPARTDAISVGAISGRVDALNVHRTPVFYLYPTSGPPRVPCNFDPTLLDDLRAAIRRHTTVRGALEYEAGNPFPTRVVVQEVEVNPPDAELPTLASLYGSVPNLTAGQDSAAFIRAQRDAEA